MKQSNKIRFEPLRLHNRVGRPLDIQICCLQIDDRYLLILRSLNSAVAAQFEKNAECIAYQLRERLGVDGEQLAFVVFGTGNDATFIRWRMDWAGASPVLIRAETTPIIALGKFLDNKQCERVELNPASAVNCA